MPILVEAIPPLSTTQRISTRLHLPFTVPVYQLCLSEQYLLKTFGVAGGTESAATLHYNEELPP